jgi:hypothetical protein
VLENVEWEYERYFPIIAEYVRSHYRNAEIPADRPRAIACWWIPM